MTFNKSILAVAVTVAISSPAFAVFDSHTSQPTDDNYWIFESLGMSLDAGVIKSKGTGAIIVAGGPNYNLDDVIETEELLNEQFHNPYTTDTSSSNDALYYSKNNSLIEIKNATLTELNFDLRNANIRGIEAEASQEYPNPYKVPHEEFLTEGNKSTFVFNNVRANQTFIETNGAHIEHDGSASAIEIKNSNLTSFKGHSVLLDNNGGEIIVDGTGNAIDIKNSTINGVISNRSWNDNRELPEFGGASAEITSTQGAALRVQDSTWRGGLVNSASITGGRSGIELVNSNFVGAISNKGKIDGTYGIALFTEFGVDSKTANSYIGDINNTGVINGSMKGVNISGETTFNGAINNSGIISGGIVNGGGNYGLFIDDSVRGDITINQKAGELSGKTALRMNKVTRTNYTGGKITGNVDNNGGIFYVEGNRTIVGNYAQSSGSTLAMGLHKNTSLTANSFNLTDGSKIVIDLTKGDLYVKNGDSVKLLFGDTTNTDFETINFEVNSSLVTIAENNLGANGILELTFNRTEIAAVIEDEISKGKYTGKTIANMRALAKAVTGNETLQNLVMEYGDQALPDVSGASVAGAMNASNQSSSQISVRARGLASGDTLDNSGLWMQGLVSKGLQDNRDGNAYDVNSHGFVLGADTELNNGLVVGGAYSFIASESKTANSNTDSDYHMATAYAAQAIGQILVDGQAYYAWGDNDSRRNIGASASYDSSLYGARVGAGYQYDIAPATRLVPTLSLEASRLSVDGYTESGFGALEMDSQNFNRLEVGLSTELSKDYQLSRAMVTPSVNLGVFHDFEAETQNSTVAFAAAPSETFNVSGTKPEKNRYVAGVGLDIMSGENLTVSAEYNYNWNGDGFDANSGALKFRWDF